MQDLLPALEGGGALARAAAADPALGADLAGGSVPVGLAAREAAAGSEVATAALTTDISLLTLHIERHLRAVRLR